MPGNTFQETTKEERERERGEYVNVIKADKQGGAQRKSTEPCGEPQIRGARDDTFLTPFASKGAASIFIKDLSSASRCERRSTK